MSPLSTTASLLKRLRVHANLTQLDLGTRIGVTKASISAYEKGKAHPSGPILTKLAHEFNLSIDELRGGSLLSPLGPAPSSLPAGPAPPLRTLREVPYLPGPSRAWFVEQVAGGSTARACEQLAGLPVPDVPPTPEFSAALVFEIVDGLMEPTLRPGARVLATPVPPADWPYLPSGLYCLVYRTTFAIKRLKDNTLLEKGLLLLHADHPLGGAYPVRADDLHAVWQVRWAVYMPLV